MVNLAQYGLNIDMSGWIPTLMGYLFYTLVGIIMLVAMFFLYHYLTFNMKVEVWNLHGSAKDGMFSVGKKKINRVKWVNNRSAWRKLWPLFNHQDIEPFDSEFIYNGNQIYAFEFNGEWMPGRINVHQSEDKFRAEINPVPHYIRNWQLLQHKKHAQEFTEHTFWDDNKYFILGIITVGICCVACLVTVYLTYKFAGGGTTAMNNLAESIKNLNVIGGIGPH